MLFEEIKPFVRYVRLLKISEKSCSKYGINSFLHFTSTEEYRKRVIQLGEDPERVHRIGQTSEKGRKSGQIITRL